MTLDHDDELIARVRRSDPLGRAAHTHHTAHSDTHIDAAARAAVAAARARRGGRSRLGVGAGLGGLAALATAVVVALGATTAGPVAAKPRIEQIVARAVQATAPEPNAIVVIESEREVSFDDAGERSAIASRGTTAALFDGAGRIVANRTRVTAARGEGVVAGTDEATWVEDGRSVLEMYDPVTRQRKRWERAYGVPSPIFQAHRLFVRAERGDQRIRLLGETRVGDRRAWRLLVTGVDEEPLDGDRDELLIDSETYQPLELRKHSEQQRTGSRYTSDSIERVISYQVVQDTTANRELLRIGGPLRAAG